MARPKKDEIVFLFVMDGENTEINAVPFGEALDLVLENELLPEGEKKEIQIARKFDVSFERQVKVKAKY